MVKIFKLKNGEVVIARSSGNVDNNIYKLSKPMALHIIPQAGIAMFPWIPGMMDEGGSISLPKEEVMIVCPPDADIEKHYMEKTSNLALSL